MDHCFVKGQQMLDLLSLSLPMSAVHLFRALKNTNTLICARFTHLIFALVKNSQFHEKRIVEKKPSNSCLGFMKNEENTSGFRTRYRYVKSNQCAVIMIHPSDYTNAAQRKPWCRFWVELWNWKNTNWQSMSNMLFTY